MEMLNMLLQTKISSKNTNTNFLKKGLKMWFMRPWNVVGALVKPKGMTKNSKCPEWVLNALLTTLKHLIQPL